MVRLGLLTMSLIAGVAAGCTDGAASAWSNPHDAATEYFITADVNGVTVRAAFEPWSGTGGVETGLIWVAAGRTSIFDGWELSIPNRVGTTACPPSWLALFEVNVPTVCSDGPGASCSVTITSAAPALGDVLEGTFTATLSVFGAAPSSAGAVAVTNGSFHVARNL